MMINEYDVCGPCMWTSVCTGDISHLERLPPFSAGDPARGVQLDVSLGLPNDITLNTQIEQNICSDFTSQLSYFFYPWKQYQCFH